MKELVNEGKRITVKVVRKNNDMLQLILVTAVMAMLAALGIILSYAVLTDTDIMQWNSGMAVGIYFILTGIIWGYLIIKNS